MVIQQEKENYLDEEERILIRDFIIKIKKDQLQNLTFEKLSFVLKNLPTKLKLNSFRSFLESKNIK